VAAAGAAADPESDLTGSCPTRGVHHTKFTLRKLGGVGRPRKTQVPYRPVNRSYLFFGGRGARLGRAPPTNVKVSPVCAVGHELAMNGPTFGPDRNSVHSIFAIYSIQYVFSIFAVQRTPAEPLNRIRHAYAGSVRTLLLRSAHAQLV
jgi:hypothetical protein